VSVIDTAARRVKQTIKLGSSNGQVNQIPTAIARSPSGSIWAACNTSGSLVVIDPSSNAITNTVEIGLADEPTGIAFA
jgi:DNA-binding beta-propeller fold protein YncE